MTTSTWYAAACPPWCAGRHGPAVGLDFDAEELITHACDLLDPQPDGLMASLAADQIHPASDCADDHNHDDAERPAAGCPACHAAAPRVYVWLPDHHDAEGVTPAQLRGWAVLLDLAADRATALLAQADQ